MIKTILTATSALAMPTNVVAQTMPVNEAKLVSVTDSPYIDASKTGMQKLVDLSSANNYTSFGGKYGFAYSKNTLSDLGNNTYHEILKVDKDTFRKNLIEINSNSSYRDELLNKVDNPVMSLMDISLDRKIYNVLDINTYVTASSINYKNIVLDLKTNDGSGDQTFFLKDISSNNISQFETPIFSLGAQDNATNIYRGVGRDLNYNMAPQVRLDNFDSNFKEMDISFDFYLTGSDGKTPKPAELVKNHNELSFNLWRMSTMIWGTNYAPQTYNFNLPVTIAPGGQMTFNNYELTTYQKLKTFGFTIYYTDPATNVAGSEIMYFTNPDTGNFAMVSNEKHLAMNYSDTNKTLTVQNITGTDLEITGITTTAHNY